MDRNQMVNERARLQAKLDGYNAGVALFDGDGAPVLERHPSLVERIAQLDRTIARTPADED